MARHDNANGTGGAMRRLVDGFGRFRAQHFDQDHELYDELLEGQHPEVMVIACSDSRTDPAIICGAEPGDLFVIGLGVRHIIVLGHSFCAGVRCLIEHDHGARRFEFVSDWVEVAREVREEMDGLVTDADSAVVARRAEQAAVLASVRHLAGYPFIAERVARGTLALHGWYFHFGWGLLQAAETPEGPFRQVDAGTLPEPALGAADAARALAALTLSRRAGPATQEGQTP
jgi:carbonic anhydrase